MTKRNRRQIKDRLLASLRERAKELNCIYRVEEALRDPGKPVQQVFSDVIEAIPPGWQFSKSCQAKIVFEGTVHKPEDYVETPWKLTERIVVQDRALGELCVSYNEELPSSDIGPFLKEEKKLIKAIAERLSNFIQFQRLRQMFDRLGGTQTSNGIATTTEWKVAIEMLAKIDQDLLVRVSRKMMNYLVLRGIAEARQLLQRYGDDLRSESTRGESNQPQERTDPSRFLKLADETFAVASGHLVDDEILERVQKWVYEDKSKFLAKALVNPEASLNEITDAIQRYLHLIPEGVKLSIPAEFGIRVALINRILGEQLGFVNIAKHFLTIEDFSHLLETVICPPGGKGRLGGKSAGLILANAVLREARKDNSEVGDIQVPRTWYITTQALLDFVYYNNLEEVHEQRYKDINEVRQEYHHIVQVFKNSHFQQELMKGLSIALDDLGEVPLIVRSSSLLEDRVGSPFSGKYKSLFLANQGTKNQRQRALMDAIAEVYASVFSPDPIEYRADHGLLDYNEEMGILIQEVVGHKVGHYFLPSFAGVAFSTNEMRWSPRINRDDGLLRLVPGLGTRAVDRFTDDYPILVAPGQPGLKVNVSIDEIVRYSPQWVDVINLESGSFDTVLLSELLAEFGDDYPGLAKIISIYRDGNLSRYNRMTTDLEKEKPVANFDALITETGFVNQVGTILKVLETTLGTPVDIEFASDGEKFFLLQCRPQVFSKDDAAAVIPKNPPEKDVIFTANKYVSNGRLPDLTHVVYVDPTSYGEIPELDTMNLVGQAIGRLNSLLPKRQFALMGPGRWGSRGDIKLGVRVTYSDISNCALLVEIARRKGNYLPDVSFGTHFFQDLVDSQIRYLPLYPDDSGVRFNENFFLSSTNILADVLPEFSHLENLIRVIDVPATHDGRVFRVLMNGHENTAMGLLIEPEAPVEATVSRQEEGFHHPEEHWIWRFGMAEQIASELDPARFGVNALYVFGSTKNATAGPQSDIDLLIHFSGTDAQKKELVTWLQGWSLCLAKINYLKTGYKTEGLLDVHIITDKDIDERSSFAVKIGAVTDAARELLLKGKKRLL